MLLPAEVTPLMQQQTDSTDCQQNQENLLLRHHLLLKQKETDIQMFSERHFGE